MLRQLRYEAYKFFRLKKGYIVIALFVAICIYGVYNNNNVNRNLYAQKDEKKLEAIFEKWGTTYEEEKSSEFLGYYQEALRISRADLSTLSEEEIVIRQNLSMLRVYFNQVTLARQSEHTDRMVDIRGYDIIISSYKEINFAIVLLTLVCTALIFSVDKQRGQEDVVKTTRYGNRIVVIAKILLTTFIIVAFVAWRFFCIYKGVVTRFDISDLSVPIQNLNYMHDVAVELTVGQAMIFVVICELIGLIFTNLVCALLITGKGSSASGFFWGFTVSYVPYFLLNADGLYKKLPLPSGMLASYNFIGEIATYKKQYIAVLFIALLLSLVVYGVYVYGYVFWNKRIKGDKSIGREVLTGESVD